MTARVTGLLLLLSLAVSGQQEVRFVTVDVIVETGDRPLAAWQVEVKTDARIVGVEGGEPAAFKAPPFYDVRALRGGRIILAAFTVDEAAPGGTLRVARLHMQETGGKTAYGTRGVILADADGARIPGRITLVAVGEK